MKGKTIANFHLPKQATGAKCEIVLGVLNEFLFRFVKSDDNGKPIETLLFSFDPKSLKFKKLTVPEANKNVELDFSLPTRW